MSVHRYYEILIFHLSFNQCTDVGFTSFLSSRFTAVTLVKETKGQGLSSMVTALTRLPFLLFFNYF